MLAYMKLLISTRGSSVEKCSSSSTISEGNTSIETVDGVLRQLKTKLVEVDLFEALEKSSMVMKLIYC